MGYKSFFVRFLAKWITHSNQHWVSDPVNAQEKWFKKLIKKGATTQFGKDHAFGEIHTYEDFKKRVPIVDYEGLSHYIERVKAGEEHVLWPGRPLYFAKTSGTTSGTKYIPISKDSISYHINAARDALFNYVARTGNAAFFDGNLIFLSGSPVLEKINGIWVGRLSGISNHHVPSWLKSNQLPSYETNCMEDWEAKVDKIVEETQQKDLRLISGIPPWVQMYFDRLMAKTGKKIKDIFPNFTVLVYGGVNFDPYKAKLIESIGKEVDSIETYPASEGFIAYQDQQNSEGLLLLVDNGMYYEFVDLDTYFGSTPERISLKDVKLGVNYALILNTNAGLWGYSIGDTIKFVSLHPHRIVVTGRVKHFISAFGEHVIGEEVEKAMHEACKLSPEAAITEFTVAPQVVDPQGGLPYHEWFIEFAHLPSNLESFALHLDEALQRLNSYYYDLIAGRVLQPLKISIVRNSGFIQMMKAKGKLGGQNKVPRLANDRKLAEELKEYLVEL